jgi:thiol-disulfide isomerase/thioredoxin
MSSPRFSALLAALRDPARWRRWGLEALILVAIVGAVTVWQNRGLPEGAAPPLAGLRNDGVSEDLSHKVGVIEGNPHGTGGTVSGTAKATLVVFWATWCPVCKAEEGNIVAVAADRPVVSVAMQSGDAAAVTKHLKERGIALPAIVDESGALAAAWRVRGVPAHFIVDPAGNIRFRVVGYATTLGLRARLWWAENFPL